MTKHCPSCFSTNFRLSKFRRGDLLRLLLLLYPVRCLECYRRGYVTLPVAFAYRGPHSRRTHKPQKA
jgi:hypothetical protein